MINKRRGVTAITVLSLFASLLTAVAAHATNIYDPSTGNGAVACTGGSVLIENNVLLSEDSWSCLDEIQIPEGVTEIQPGALEGGVLTSISIPSSVRTIGDGALTGIRYLTSIQVDSANAFFKDDDGVLFSKSGDALIVFPAQKSGPYSIPNTVTSIGNDAFSYANLGSIFIPSSIISIGDSAFRDTDLSTITIPASVTSIGEYAFENSTLTSVSIGENVELIGRRAFYNTSLTSINIPRKVSLIGESAFLMSPIQAFTVAPENTFFKSVLGVLFTKNGETLISYPKARAGQYTIPSDVTTIGHSAFYDAATLSTITIPASVRTIGEDAFRTSSGNSLFTSVVFAAGSQLTTIGQSAFGDLSSLASLSTIPASVTSIGDSAFYDTRLTSLTFAPNSQLVSIGDGAFANVGTIETLSIPASVLSIGNYAFYGSTALRSLRFESNSRLATIGSDAFTAARVLTTLTIPASVITIGRRAFQNADALSSLTFEVSSQLTTIGEAAFSYAGALTSVSIPASVSDISGSAFASAQNLTTLTFESDSRLQAIGYFAFQGTNLGSVTIPAGVRSIGDWAFNTMTTIPSVYFLGDAPSVGQSAFRGGFGYVSDCATGFTPVVAGRWNGLALSVVPSSSPCLALFNLTGGTGITSASLGAGGQIALPSSPTRDGYSFGGWSATIDGALIVTFPYNAGSGTSNTTLFANWTPNTYIVRYDSRGGSAVANGSFVTGGEIASAPTPPTRVGHRFMGWLSYPSEWEGEGYEFPYSPEEMSDITFYAAWLTIPGAQVPEVQTPVAPQNNSQPSPPLSVPQPNPPQVIPPVVSVPVALVQIASITMVFSSGSKNLATSAQTEIRKLITKSGPEAKYTISASATMVRGLPRSFVSNLAKARAAKIRAYLVKLGIRSEDISINLTVNKSGKSPAAKITVKK